MADETDFFQLVVANERIGQWMAVLKSRSPFERKKQVLLSLKIALQCHPAYVEEARSVNVVATLTRLLAQTGPASLQKLKDDEEAMDAIAAIITYCSGDTAAGAEVRDYSYEGYRVRIKQGAIGDGLGARVWTVAHILCMELVAYPSIVKGCRVLELGSGCGVAGILAAKLGAQQVLLTDHEPVVLGILRECMHLNVASPDQPQQPQQRASGSIARLPSDDSLFDDEEVQDFALAELAGGSGEPAPAGQEDKGTDQRRPAAAAALEWQAASMQIYHLDWLDAYASLDGPQAAADLGLPSAPLSSAPVEGPATPSAPAEEQYEVVIGTDVMYEPLHARLVAAAVKHRLRPGGKCLLTCAVRQQEVFDLFAAECQRRRLRYRCKPVQPMGQYSGVLGRNEDYEGGFLLMALDHQDKHCPSWHRDDFEEVV